MKTRSKSAAENFIKIDVCEYKREGKKYVETFKSTYTIESSYQLPQPLVLNLHRGEGSSAITPVTPVTPVSQPTPPPNLKRKRGFYRQVYSDDSSDSDNEENQAQNETVEDLQEQLQNLSERIANYKERPVRRRKSSNKLVLSDTSAVLPDGMRRRRKPKLNYNESSQEDASKKKQPRRKSARLNSPEPEQQTDEPIILANCYINLDNSLNNCTENVNLLEDLMARDSGLDASPVVAVEISQDCFNNPSSPKNSILTVDSQKEDDSNFCSDLPLAQQESEKMVDEEMTCTPLPSNLDIDWPENIDLPDSQESIDITALTGDDDLPESDSDSNANENAIIIPPVVENVIVSWSTPPEELDSSGSDVEIVTSKKKKIEKTKPETDEDLISSDDDDLKQKTFLKPACEKLNRTWCAISGDSDSNSVDDVNLPGVDKVHPVTFRRPVMEFTDSSDDEMQPVICNENVSGLSSSKDEIEIELEKLFSGQAENLCNFESKPENSLEIELVEKLSHVLPNEYADEIQSTNSEIEIEIQPENSNNASVEICSENLSEENFMNQHVEIQPDNAPEENSKNPAAEILPENQLGKEENESIDEAENQPMEIQPENAPEENLNNSPAEISPENFSEKEENEFSDEVENHPMEMQPENAPEENLNNSPAEISPENQLGKEENESIDEVEKQPMEIQPENAPEENLNNSPTEILPENLPENKKKESSDEVENHPMEIQPENSNNASVEICSENRAEENFMNQQVEIQPDNAPEENLNNSLAENLPENLPENEKKESSDEVENHPMEIQTENESKDEAENHQMEIQPENAPEENLNNASVEICSENLLEEDFKNPPVEICSENLSEENFTNQHVEIQPENAPEENSNNSPAEILPENQLGKQVNESSDEVENQPMEIQPENESKDEAENHQMEIQPENDSKDEAENHQMKMQPENDSKDKAENYQMEIQPENDSKDEAENDQMEMQPENVPEENSKNPPAEILPENLSENEEKESKDEAENQPMEIQKAEVNADQSMKNKPENDWRPILKTDIARYLKPAVNFSDSDTETENLQEDNSVEIQAENEPSYVANYLPMEIQPENESSDESENHPMEIQPENEFKNEPMEIKPENSQNTPAEILPENLSENELCNEPENQPMGIQKAEVNADQSMKNKPENDRRPILITDISRFIQPVVNFSDSDTDTEDQSENLPFKNSCEIQNVLNYVPDYLPMEIQPENESSDEFEIQNEMRPIVKTGHKASFNELTTDSSDSDMETENQPMKNFNTKFETVINEDSSGSSDVVEKPPDVEISFKTHNILQKSIIDYSDSDEDIEEDIYNPSETIDNSVGKLTIEQPEICNNDDFTNLPSSVEYGLKEAEIEPEIPKTKKAKPETITPKRKTRNSTKFEEENVENEIPVIKEVSKKKNLKNDQELIDTDSDADFDRLVIDEELSAAEEPKKNKKHKKSSDEEVPLKKKNRMDIKTEIVAEPEIRQNKKKLQKVLNDDSSLDETEIKTESEMDFNKIAPFPEHFLKDLAAVKLPNPNRKKQQKVNMEDVKRKKKDKKVLENFGASTAFSAKVVANCKSREEIAANFKKIMLFSDRNRRCPAKKIQAFAAKQKF